MRRAVAAAAALAVLAVPGVASGAEDDATTAPATTSAAPTTATPTVPERPSLLDILEALYGPGVFEGCCGTQPTPQPSPGYRPPPNTLTPPAPASSRFTPLPPRTYGTGAVVPGGGASGPTAAPDVAVPTVADVPGATAAPETGQAATTTAGCVPNAVRGSAGYSLVDDPDGDGVSCTPALPAGYADPAPASDAGIPTPVLLVAVAAAVVLGAALAWRPRLRGRHRTRGARP